MKTLYANGDSFVFGMECLQPEIKSEKNKDLAFPKYISDMLGCTEYINNSHNGATNEFIFRKTLLDLRDLEKKGTNPADVFVIVGITSLHRTEIDGVNWFGNNVEFDSWFKTNAGKDSSFVSYPHEYEKYGTIFVQPGLHLDAAHESLNISLDEDVKVFLTRFIWHEKVLLRSQEARMIALHEYLNIKGYKHIFVNTVCPINNSTNLDFSCKNFYRLHNDAFWRYAYANFPKEKQKYGHFSTVPHKTYARILVDYIKKNLV